jgi:23S rRNA (uracil1939-C5)-methyltransferase
LANQLRRPPVGGNRRSAGPGRDDREDVTLDVEIETLDASGDGVASYRGRTLIVPFTIPGELVPPHRIAPYCPHFGPPALRARRDPDDAPRAGAPPDADPGAGPCGGCAWQHIAYPEQLRLKTSLVTRLVRQAVPHAPAARPMLQGAPLDYPWGYRNKVHFVFGAGPGAGRRPGPLIMGHYVRGSRRILQVRECPVHDERGNALAFRLHRSYAAAGSPRPEPTLKSLAIRVGHGTSEIMATLVVTEDADKRVRAATRRVLDEPGAPTSFHVNVHPRGDAFIFGSDTRRIAGPERMREEVAGVSFLISPTAFFQTNVHAAETLVRLVLDEVPPVARVLDLYAGAGLFAIPLARAGHQVIAVEENRAAVADGETSLRLNRIGATQCQFVARRVEEALAAGFRHPIDVVVLDPPRDGCSAEVIDRVFEDLAPARAVYISCNPEALARDLAEIAHHGYRIRSMQPVDMFPHTAHVETVVSLTRDTD